MISIIGGEPELCGMARQGMLSKPYALHVRKSCLECSARACVVLYVEKGLCEVTGEKN